LLYPVAPNHSTNVLPVDAKIGRIGSRIEQWLVEVTGSIPFGSTNSNKRFASNSGALLIWASPISHHAIRTALSPFNTA
jgi:hypothetical protein